MNDSDKSVPVLISYDKSDVDYPENQTWPPRIEGAYKMPLQCINEQKLASLSTSSQVLQSQRIPTRASTLILARFMGNWKPSIFPCYVRPASNNFDTNLTDVQNPSPE
jgi:hypothetical protein